MSAPPAYPGSHTPVNPDSRPLPEGWIQQYDSNYKTWFYVNTRANPPVTTWTHPLGAAPPPPPPPTTGYVPPSGPPPPNHNQPSGYPDNRAYGAPQGGYYGGPPSGYNGSPQGGYNGGGYGGPPQQGGYGYPNQQQGWQQQQQPYNQSGSSGGKGLLGGLFGGKTSGGSNAVYGQAPPKKSGFGAGGLLTAGGVGLIGGALLEHAIEDDIREDAYESGYDNGYDQGFDQGFDDGGGW